MKKKSPVFLFILFCPVCTGLAYSDENAFPIFTGDKFSSVRNPFYPAQTKHKTISFLAANYYIFKEINTVSVSALIPFSHSGVGMYAGRFGNEIYSHTFCDISVAQKVNEWFSAGIKAKYNALAIRSYGRTSDFDAEFAFRTSINKHIESAVLISSFLPNTFEHLTGKRNAVWGIVYSPDKTVKMVMELVKTRQLPLQLNTAFSYQKDSVLHLYFFLVNQFRSPGICIQFKTKNWVYAVKTQVHSIGIASTFALSYEFKD